MIKLCDMTHLPLCVEIAFKKNGLPENSCAYCPNSEASIRRDFEFIINDPDCLMAGCFVDDALIGVLGCFLNPENNWVDCVGPFFRDEWNENLAKEMFLFAKAALSRAVRFNFFFNVENENCHRLMESLSAQRKDNEYILLLTKSDYISQPIKHSLAKYESKYENDLIRLHDGTFSDVYVTGREIVDTADKTREVFCVLDEAGEFAGYGVLKYAGDSNHLTAEIFAVEGEKRGKGYGWALLNAVVDSAFNNHGGTVVDLVVDKLNTNARNLYYSCGFKLAVENEAYCLRV